MTENILYLLIGALAGGTIAYLYAVNQNRGKSNTDHNQLTNLEREFATYKATVSEQLLNANRQRSEKEIEIRNLKEQYQALQSQVATIRDGLVVSNANLQATKSTVFDKMEEIEILAKDKRELQEHINEVIKKLALAEAINLTQAEKLDNQKEEIFKMGEKFNLEFENIANKLLESKSEKFTELNRANLKSILEPLDKNLMAFKSKVEEVYDKESKERFSLGEKVKELALLNQVIGDEARRLTNALKGEAKTQGRWGEMILENILEKSGLVKGREYFMEYELHDKFGNHLRSDLEEKKMRPDAVIKYPDNRSVIIDSKVSLNAFLRYLNTTDIQQQKIELVSHVSALKAHIVSLSNKGYDDYDRSLDFVMLFIPSEPAYIAALQSDSELWNFAYDKRILLLSPTNLITSLKLIVDLWKREYQNQNAQEIAERGAKLYDKFCSFLNNMQDIGNQLDKAQGKYQDAFKQLTSGNDNLILQTTKLKSLGLKTKKSIPDYLQENTVME